LWTKRSFTHGKLINNQTESNSKTIENKNGAVLLPFPGRSDMMTSHFCAADIGVRRGSNERAWQ
jgi:hypothetical protein